MAQQTVILQPGSTQAASASGRFLNIVSCTAGFKVEMDNNGQNVAVAGSQFSTEQSFKRLVFEETQGVKNTIVFDANQDPSPSRPTVMVSAASSLVGTNPGPLTNTDPLATGLRDTSVVGDPGTFAAYTAGFVNFGSIFSFALPPNKPYRRIWCRVDAATFPAGEAILLNLFFGGHPAVNANTTFVASLPARNKVLVPPVGTAAAWAPTEFGFAASAGPDTNNRNLMPGDMYYRNTDGSGIFYPIHPFDFYALADTCDLGKTASVAGVIRAFVAVLSSEVPLV